MKEYRILENLSWLTRFMGQEKRKLLSWPLVQTGINLATTLLAASLPALVVWAFTDPGKYQLTLPLLVLVSGISGFLTWFNNWYNRKLFWENTKLGMNLDLQDTKYYLTQPFMDSLDHAKQEQRFSSTQYAFFDETTGVGIFLQQLAQFTASLVSLIVVSLLTLRVHPLIFALIWLSFIINDYLLQKVTKKRSKLRAEIGRLQDQHWYYRKITADEEASTDIRLYQLAGKITAKLTEIQEAVERTELRVSRLKIGYQIGMLLLNCLRFAISFVLLLKAIKLGQLDVSTFTFYFGLLTSVEALLNNNAHSLLNLQSANSDLTKGRQYYDQVAATIEQTTKPQLAAPTSYDIEFRHVNFAYQPQQPIIRDFSLTIKEGEQLALVGLNGAGKTTLTLLLLGYLQPTSGQILVGGLDLAQLTSRQRLNLFSAMFQENTVLATDVVGNIAVKVAADTTKVNQVLSQTNLLDKVAALPKGLKTQLTKYITDSGQDFSGGELESLMLARALYKQAPIMLLDEPTAALDALAERAFYEQVAQLIQGKTTIFISHRLASTSNSDRVCFMADGRITGLGTHTQLLRTNSAYRKLYQSQAKYYQKENSDDRI